MTTTRQSVLLSLGLVVALVAFLVVGDRVDALTAINLATQVNGLLGVSHGGTGASLSATGGAHQFLEQATTGAAITVGQPASTDLSDTANLALLNGTTAFTANQRINAGLGVNIAPGATGTLSLSDGIFERSRTTKLGEWTAVAYSAGNFTVTSGGGTWTVDSGDQAFYSYTVIGKTMTLDVVLNATSITGSVSQIGVAIPGGFTCPGQAWGTSFLYDNSSSVFVPAAAFMVSTKVLIQKGDGTNFTASTNNTYIRVLMSFPIA